MRYHVTLSILVNVSVMLVFVKVMSVKCVCKGDACKENSFDFDSDNPAGINNYLVCPGVPSNVPDSSVTTVLVFVVVLV